VDELTKQLEVINNELKADEEEVIEEVVKILKENLEEDYRTLLKSIFVPQNNEYKVNLNEKLKLADLVTRKFINTGMKLEAIECFSDENVKNKLINDLFETDFDELSILILAYALMISLHDYTLFINENYNAIKVEPIEKSLALKNLEKPISDMLNDLFKSIDNKKVK